MDLCLSIPTSRTELLVRFEAMDEMEFAAEGSPICVPCRLRLLLKGTASAHDALTLMERLRAVLELLVPKRTKRKPGRAWTPG